MYCSICKNNFSQYDAWAICAPCHAAALAEAPKEPTWADNALRNLRGKLSGHPSGNYVADREERPRKVVFANGRTVEIVDGALVVGWALPIPQDVT